MISVASISTICTVVLTVVTTVYVVLTYGLLKTSRETMSLAKRPIIQIGAKTRPGSPVLQLWITNVGNSTARNLRLRIHPDLLPFHGKLASRKMLNSYRTFSEPIESFPPQTEILIDLGLSMDFFHGEEDVKSLAPTKFAVEASYSGIDSVVFSESTQIDLEIFRVATAAKYGELGELHGIRNELEKLVDAVREISKNRLSD